MFYRVSNGGSLNDYILFPYRIYQISTNSLYETITVPIIEGTNFAGMFSKNIVIGGTDNNAPVDVKITNSENVCTFSATKRDTNTNTPVTVMADCLYISDKIDYTIETYTKNVSANGNYVTTVTIPEKTGYQIYDAFLYGANQGNVDSNTPTTFTCSLSGNILTLSKSSRSTSITPTVSWYYCVIYVKD